jgi:two-component system, OmpR family, phosphate regulon response regulator PhoB
MPSTILVVEDEPAIQELVAVNLTFAGHKALRAATVDQATTLIRAELPDLILLDWMLPGSSGIHFARKLRSDERTRDIPIIMLTARSNESDKVEGLEAGADDYITKPFSPKELIARIKAVLRRRAPQLTDDLVELGGLRLDPATHRLTGTRSDGTLLPLEIGPTEFRLLHFVMTHPERVYSRAQLLDQVWGDHVFLEERTVDVHIRRLRHSLTPSALEFLVETVRGSGYRFSVEAQPKAAGTKPESDAELARAGVDLA